MRQRGSIVAKTVGLQFSEVQAGCAGVYQGALRLAFRLGRTGLKWEGKLAGYWDEAWGKEQKKLRN